MRLRSSAPHQPGHMWSCTCLLQFTPEKSPYSGKSTLLIENT
jgi:hypothetical protein